MNYLTRLFLAPTDALGRPLRGREASRWGLAASLTSWVIVLLGLSIACWLVYTQARYEWNWTQVWEYRQPLIQGWFTTLWLAALALACSLLIGTVTALCLRSRLLPLRYLARLYVEIVRGTPLLVQLLLGYYAVLDILFQLHEALPAGILLLSLFSGAYIAEIVRGGLDAIGATQRESALAIGLTKVQMYQHVIFPQTVRLVLPGLAGQFANVIKDSSLLYVITVPEFTAAARNVNAATYSALESYIPLAVGYLALTLPISLLSRWLERRTKFET
jgi:polar amino acid transport system permease protein